MLCLQDVCKHSLFLTTLTSTPNLLSKYKDRKRGNVHDAYPKCS